MRRPEKLPRPIQPAAPKAKKAPKLEALFPPSAKARGTTVRGNIAPRIVAGSEISLSVDGDSGVVQLKGGYAALLAVRPAKGSVYEYQEVDFIVLSTKLRLERAGCGVLSIVLGDITKSGSGSPNLLEDPNVTIEIDYTLIEKPLETNPFFNDLFRGAATDQLKALRKWESIGDDAIDLKIDLKYPLAADSDPSVPEDWAALPELAAKFATKKLAGIEAYFKQVPVVRKTTVIPAPISTSSAGQRENPPDFTGEGIAWLKTADKVISRKQKGAWERIEEWTGFESLDEELYPDPSP
jgi:hypothetical protein